MLVKKKDIHQLSKIREDHCISIYIPTHRSGFENAKIDQLNFKNALGEARIEMEKRKVVPNELHKALQPAYELLEEESFWNNMSDVLVVFISPNHFEYYELPISFNSFVHISDRYYLRPLLPMFAGDGRFFVLALSQNQVRFFEGSRHSITPIIIQDLVPENMEEILLLGENEANLQMKSNGQNNSRYFGHGSGKDDKNIQLEKYFRQVDDGLMEMLYDETEPLLIASVDYLAPMYKSVSNYPYIMEANLKGNPEHWSPMQLHERAWQIIEPHFKVKQKTAEKEFNHKFSKHEAAISTHDVVPAAYQGRIQTLFVDKHTSTLWGAYNDNKARIEIHQSRKENSKCLLNEAAIQTFLKGGKVFNVQSEEMPFPFALMNAIYRF